MHREPLVTSEQSAADELERAVARSSRHLLSRSELASARTNPWAVGTAAIANGGILAIFILLGLNTTVRHPPNSSPAGNIHLRDFKLFAPTRAQSGSNGAGSHDLIDPIVGRPPRRDVMPMTPPQIPIIENPKLAIDAAIPLSLQLPDNPAMPDIGAHKSPNVSLASGGPGGPAGIGSGKDGVYGPGHGNGGPGIGPGSGNGIYLPGMAGVTNPVPIVSPEAEFSDEARRQKYQGMCMISVIVDAHGFPQNPRVIRSLGMGLDEKALAAVAKYRFKPAMKDGRAVAVQITVAVNFRLY